MTQTCPPGRSRGRSTFWRPPGWRNLAAHIHAGREILQFAEPLFFGHLLKNPNGKTAVSGSKTGIVMVIARPRTFFIHGIYLIERQTGGAPWASGKNPEPPAQVEFRSSLVAFFRLLQRRRQALAG